MPVVNTHESCWNGNIVSGKRHFAMGNICCRDCDMTIISMRYYPNKLYHETLECGHYNGDDCYWQEVAL